jgi:rsbT co-antagonist protein RsbR
LALATTGKLSDRIPLEDDGEERLLELEYGVNMLFDELERSRTESAAQQRELEQQSAALLEKEREMVRLLSTPVITVWPGVLALPILGEVGRERAVTMTESVLNQVVEERATHVILDLTGMTVVGAETAMSPACLSVSASSQVKWLRFPPWPMRLQKCCESAAKSL